MNILKGSLPKTSNYKKGRTGSIKYIVIHYTGNKGDTALNNVKYFSNNVVKASAHYFVDETNIYSSVPITDTAWHCGGGKQSNQGGSHYQKCTNNNSIGIEMCVLDSKGNVKSKTVDNAIELTKKLMKEHNIPVGNVIRHWDVVGKNCPAPFVGDNNERWIKFKKRLNEQSGGDLGMEDKMIYNYIDDNMPEFAKPTIRKLCDKGILKGDSSGLNLTYDMLRILTIIDRAGIFDRG